MTQSGMRKPARMLAAVGMVAALTLPAQASTAVDAQGRCGGKWDAGGVCNFVYTGGRVTYGASYLAENEGFVTVTIEAEGPVDGTRVPVVSCGAFGGDAGRCGGTLGADETNVERGQTLYCVVQGAERGRYACRNVRR